MGAIAFNHQPTVLSSPTTDYASVRHAVSKVKAAGTTATGDALSAALQMVRTARSGDAADAPAAIVLLSDGKTTRMPPDIGTLREVSRVTGGQAFAIEDAAELDRVYERLGSQVATERRDQEVTSLFGGGALLLGAVGLVASLPATGRLI